jgi:hypothetical protein
MSDYQKWKAHSESLAAARERHKQEHPSLPETKLGEAVIHFGIVIFFTILVLAMVAPIFIPWALRECNKSMKNWDGNGNPNPSEAEYNAELQARKIASTIFIFIIWGSAIGFFWFLNAIGYAN